MIEDPKQERDWIRQNNIAYAGLLGVAFLKVTKPVAQNAAFVAIVAGFWHITWIAGIAMLAATLVAVAVHSAGLSRMWR